MIKSEKKYFDFISPKDVIDLWANRKAKNMKFLYIIIDSPYGGHWVNYIQVKKYNNFLKQYNF